MLVRLRKAFANLTFNQRFMLAGLVILLGGMAGIGAWVENQIVTGVIHRTGVTTALYVDSFVAPNLQELGQSDQLLPEHMETLRKLLRESKMGQQIVALKVWNTRGKLLFSTDSSTVGKIYPMHEGLLRARLGEVVSSLSPLDEEENQVLGAVHEQLLETYSPVWQSGTDQVIAVAEFYQRTDEMEKEIGILQQQSWLVVGLAIALMYLLLAGFVRNASETITQQQKELGQKVVQLTGLLYQNRELNERVRRASGSVALLNEGYLRRVGSELHDGPAQDLGLSLLKLDSLIGRLEDSPGQPVAPGVVEELNQIETALQNALKEMRGIAAGLSLPQLKELDLSETVTRVVRTHERRTGTSVALNLALGSLSTEIALPVKITVYRLVQEALNNAYRHAGGAGQQVCICSQENQLVIEVTDTGLGFQVEQLDLSSGRLGLGGMRERVESLGGRFTIESQVGQGTKILAHLPYGVEGGMYA